MAKKEKDVPEESFDELVATNITSLTNTVTQTTDTVTQLVEKITSMACHIVALEAMLTEMNSLTGVDLAKVNKRIRARIAAQGDSEVVVDLAAAIASPSPKS